MKHVKHHRFTLWIYDWERNEEKVPAVHFYEDASYDEIALIMLSLDELGIQCSLTCETWTQVVSDESEDLKND